MQSHDPLLVHARTRRWKARSMLVGNRLAKFAVVIRACESGFGVVGVLGGPSSSRGTKLDVERPFDLVVL